MSNTRVLHAAIVALAIVLAQWAGIVHRHEHSSGFQRDKQHAHSEQFLHDCLAFDALTTAHTPVSLNSLGFTPPQLALIGKATAPQARHTGQATTHRTRVRDPPTLI